MPTKKKGKSPGRPKGSGGPAQARTRVQKFTPRRDQVIMFHLSGMTHKQIAEATGYTPQRVYELLTDPEAMEIVQQGRARIINGMMNSIDGRLVQLASRSLDNIEKTVNAKIGVLHPAKRHQDKVGMELLSMIGYGNDKGRSDKPVGISNEVADRLAVALEKANKVQEIEIVDAEFELLENPLKKAV